MNEVGIVGEYGIAMGLLLAGIILAIDKIRELKEQTQDE